MKTIPSLKLFLMAAAVSITTLSTCVTHAQMITVPNFSFESPAPAGYGFDVPTSWFQVLGDPGQVGTQEAPFVPSGVTGSYSMFHNIPVGAFAEVQSETLGAVASNSLYTLTVALAGSNGGLLIGDYDVSLFSTDGFAFTTLNTQTVVGTTVTVGAFQDFSLSFNSASLPSVVGQQLVIGLRSSSLGYVTPGTYQANFDNVRLNVVPEPSTISLLVLAIGAVLISRWRRTA